MTNLKIKQPHILVVGDLMIDHYLWGSCQRISPEAPVPVVDIESQTTVLGGAGNVINNLVSLGAKVGVASVIGDDDNAKELLDMLKLINEQLKQRYLTIFIDHPFFDKRDLLEMLYEAKNMPFNPFANFNTLKEEIVKKYKDTNHTIFLDEAQLLNDEQFELIRILSDTKVFQFVLSMHKEEGSVILQKKHFKSRTKAIVYLQSLRVDEIKRYIDTTLLLYGYGDIAQLFKNTHIKLIAKYTKGNFRMVKKYLYTLMRLLAYAKKTGITKYQKINNCLLDMSALDIGLIDDER